MVVNCEEVWREIRTTSMGGSNEICGLPWKSTSAAAGAALLCLTACVTSFSCTEMKGCSKCRWASASVCSTGWRRRNFLVAGEALDGCGRSGSLGC